MEILDKIFRKEDIQGPIESDPELLFKAGKFEKVDRTPEPPCDESREIDAKNSADTGATTDRRQQTECLEPEGGQVAPANTRDNIVGQHFAFTGGMLGGGWLISSLLVRNHRAVTERPHTWKTLDSHRGVGLQAIAFLG